MKRLSRRRKNVINTVKVEEQTVIDVEDFETSVHLFLRDRKIKNLSEHTLKYYRTELLGTMRQLERQGVETHPSTITDRTIKENVILDLMEAGRKETTINARLRALRSFFGFLSDEGMIAQNPFDDVGLIKQHKEIIQTFTRAQLREILSQADQGTFTGVRDYTLMLLMVETGARVREVCDITINDIKWEDNQIKLNGKGAKDRLVPFQKTMKRQLRKYMAVRGHVSVTDILFVNIDDKPLSRRRVQEIVAKYGRMANIKNVRCSPHTFRHTFAKIAVQNGADVFALQAMLGHTSLEMVRNYVNLFSSDVFEKHKHFSPVENLF
ncbi:recombinase XerD [Halalkalibacterium halodurans]|nr:tyrosine-type recombinase/integrase [Halalkalibacterium halodurans]TPE67966.1 recombinase XerD [Halalkalibacterium halodurans]